MDKQLNYSNYSISIVVPCHNAEKFLSETIGKLYSHLHHDEELIIVENGSSDRTFLALSELAKSRNFENVTIAQSPKGLGVALKHGVDLARGKTIVFMEDDLPFGFQELNLARKKETTSSYYILSKYHGTVSGLGFRRIQGLIFIFLRESILRLKVKDSQATFFGDTEIVKNLCSKSQQEGFLITLELIAIARKLGVSIIEIPCDSFAKSIRPSTLTIRDVIQMFLGLFGIKQSLRNVRNEN
jgi:dolichyl-phosphate beta-glucosyltransferase